MRQINLKRLTKLGRRDMPILALAATLGVGGVMSVGGSAAPDPVRTAARTVTPQLSYLTQAQPATVVDSAAGTVATTAESGATIPDIEHSSVSKWVSRFTGTRKHDIETVLGRMGKYTAMITRKLEERGMPQELVYLAAIESGGNAKATSPVKAKGLWQFMAPTAKQYGLTVNKKVDERVNPEKATDAALDYLEDLHERFGSWYLAAAAYNVGQGRVSKVMKQVTGKSKGTDADFYKIAPKLPQETRDYVPKLVAVARIAKAPEKFGVDAPALQASLD